MNALEKAVALLPEDLRARARDAPETTEELRLRPGRPLSALCGEKERPLGGSPLRQEHLEALVEKATGASMHTASEALAQGYYCVDGLRIGVCGQLDYRGGQVRAFHRIRSAAIRIPRELNGILDAVFRELPEEERLSCLILSPPGGGKTSALREWIRVLSNSGGIRIGVTDERGELMGDSREGSAFDLGPTVDVMSGAPKAEAALMLLRSMNPQVLAMDEISTEEDCRTVERLSGCGVGLLATIHAEAFGDPKRSPVLRRLLAGGAFRNLLVIRRQGDRRVYRLERVVR